MSELSLLEWTFGMEVNIPKRIEDMLIRDEKAICAFKTIRDVAVFTNKRLIVSDTQGLTGKKKEVYNLPYHAINMFSIENAGHLDFNSEVELWTRAGRIKINLLRGADINKISRVIAEHIL